MVFFFVVKGIIHLEHSVWVLPGAVWPSRTGPAISLWMGCRVAETQALIHPTSFLGPTRILAF